MSAIRTSKIRLYPNVSQEVTLLETLRICKDVWNILKGLMQDEYKTKKKIFSYIDLIKKIPQIKQIELKYDIVYSQVLQNVAKRLTDAYKSFFALLIKGYKARIPRFKTLKRYHSFTYPQFGFKFKDGRIYLSKIGSIKYRGNLPKGKIKTFTVKKSKTDKWFGFIVYEKKKEIFKANLPSIGIDLGLEKFATLSDGNVIPIPHFYRETEKRVRIAHRKLSRKIRGSKNRLKARMRLARVYEKVNNKRLDFLHKNSSWMAENYAIIYVEDLNIFGMAQGLKLGKSIHDASWRKFLHLLEYKLEERNGSLIKVDSRYTSQICSCCDALVKKSLSMRVHHCPVCGLEIDRDLNASRNILRIGMGHAEFTPAGDVAPTQYLVVEQVASMNQEASQVL